MDALMVGFVGGFVWGGWRTGFLRRLIGLGFVAISLVVSAYFRYAVGAIATTLFKGIPPEYADLVGYAIAFPAILAGLHLASYKLLGKVAVSGLTKETDRALGALFGGLEAILILSVFVVIFDTYFKTSAAAAGAAAAGELKQLDAAMKASTTVRLLRDTTVPATLTVLGPILPRDISSLLSQALPGGVPGGLPGGGPGGLPFPTP
jgi:uncharacterized membrane protein required for colicin V production